MVCAGTQTVRFVLVCRVVSESFITLYVMILKL